MKWFINDDFDRYDVALTLLFGLIAVSILILGAPLWAIVLIYVTCGLIVMYRHLPLPPRRR